MAKIILPYTIQNGNTADGGQVQQDFDAILTQVNGNLDNANLADGAVSTTKLVDGAVTEAKLATDAVIEAKIKDGAVTLAKLASDVKVIEQVYSDFVPYYLNGSTVGTSITLPQGTETTIFEQAVTLSSNRYLMFQCNYLLSGKVGGAGNWIELIVKDGTDDILNIDFQRSDNESIFGYQFIKQIAAGSHTFYFNLRPNSDSENIKDRAFTIVQFNF